ncbi:hypothetical protein [Litorilituus sediminis]|uniref:Uncharacterized protein n=1 Tax=Litorilituus sediminis TaxID=718192 RepID=A0A4P6P0M5_9GAMM|nr:hypothetical protein [Litorilituus sediminis]QBG34453.1 hypothetical protein EMK97_01225 [Litorilituus sediminis]
MKKMQMKHIGEHTLHVIQSYGRESKEAEGLLNMLANLAPTGAKRRNFIKKYVSPAEGWLKLPKDPNDIPYGFWY